MFRRSRHPRRNVSFFEGRKKYSTLPLVIFYSRVREIFWPNVLTWTAWKPSGIQSDETGKFEVLVRPFPNVNDGRWQISSASGGGRWPRWSRDGAELFYWSDDTLMAVAVETEPTFRPAPPSPLFDYPGIYRNVGRPYDVAPDAQRFLLVDTSAGVDGVPSTSTHIRVVLNWIEELKARVPIEK